MFRDVYTSKEENISYRPDRCFIPMNAQMVPSLGFNYNEPLFAALFQPILCLP